MLASGLRDDPANRLWRCIVKSPARVIRLPSTLKIRIGPTGATDVHPANQTRVVARHVVRANRHPDVGQRKNIHIPRLGGAEKRRAAIAEDLVVIEHRARAGARAGGLSRHMIATGMFPKKSAIPEPHFVGESLLQGGEGIMAVEVRVYRNKQAVEAPQRFVRDAVELKTIGHHGYPPDGGGSFQHQEPLVQVPPKKRLTGSVDRKRPDEIVGTLGVEKEALQLLQRKLVTPDVSHQISMGA